tara:strand:+ start:89 stop:235 length:147 start_codon:yes stop_codon:yes gene_type:complete
MNNSFILIALVFLASPWAEAKENLLKKWQLETSGLLKVKYLAFNNLKM